MEDNMDKVMKDILELYKTTSLSVPGIGKRLGFSKDMVEGRLRRWFAKHPEDKRSAIRNCVPENTDLTLAMSEDEFVRPYDWKAKLREGIDSLIPGSNKAVIADEDFRRHLGISETKWRKLKTLQEFKRYQLMVKSSIYWCQPETGQRLRAKIELSDEVL
jgi:hypothetical protein